MLLIEEPLKFINKDSFFGDFKNILHIWIFDLDSSGYGGFISSLNLSLGEKEHSKKIKSREKREKYTLRRNLVRILLSRYLWINPGKISFQYGLKGKPALEDENGEGTYLFFNTSRSRNLFVVAVTDLGDVGIDIERKRKEMPLSKISKRFFHEREISYLDKLDDEAVCNEFFRVWVMKEAVLKAHGSGISGGTGSFSVLTDKNEYKSKICFEESKYYMADINIDDNFSSSVAIRSEFVNPKQLLVIKE